MPRTPSPFFRVVYENACETCDAKGPIVELQGEEGPSFICGTCAKLAVAILRELGLVS